MDKDYIMECRCFKYEKQVGWPMGVNWEHGGEYYLKGMENGDKCRCDEGSRVFRVFINGTQVCSIYGGKLVQG